MKLEVKQQEAYEALKSQSVRGKNWTFDLRPNI